MMQATTPHTDRVVLSGLAASNLLGFMAALGVLRVLTTSFPQECFRLCWKRLAGSWRPELIFPAASPELLIKKIDPALKITALNPAIHFADNPAVSVEKFAEQERLATAKALAGDRTFADFLASLGSSAAADKNGSVADTAFRTMQGAGHQHFLGTMSQLAQATTPEQVRTALFDPWNPVDEKLGLRWDTAEDRVYALRWDNPSGDAVMTVRGANRLAFEALPFFPVLSNGGRGCTTGFGGADGTTLTYPVWETPITGDAVLTLLALAELQEFDLQPYRERLAAMGIPVVYRCRRITRGKYRNFSPPFPI